MRVSRKTVFTSGSVALILWLCLAFAFAQAPAKRPLAIDDVLGGLEISDPQVSPDGGWIAYTVAWMDRQADKARSAVWMVDWEGRNNVPMTSGPEGDTAPRWSPDGKYLSFLSTRPADGKTQVWLLDRRGGEARPGDKHLGALRIVFPDKGRQQIGGAVCGQHFAAMGNTERLQYLVGALHGFPVRGASHQDHHQRRVRTTRHMHLLRCTARNTPRLDHPQKCLSMYWIAASRSDRIFVQYFTIHGDMSW